MRWITLLLMTATPALSEGMVQNKTVDCYCTDKTGNRIELGEMTCLHVGGRSFMAQCQMSLNVPMWREISDGCLSSSLSGGQSPNPSLDTGGVHTQI